MSRIDRIVDEIWEEELSFSDIPEGMHDDLKTQVRPSLFLLDGKFDRPAFRAAVEAEVKEWDRLLVPHVMGTGFITNRDTSGRLVKGPKALEKEDNEWVSEMLKLGGQID